MIDILKEEVYRIRGPQGDWFNDEWDLDCSFVVQEAIYRDFMKYGPIIDIQNAIRIDTGMPRNTRYTIPGIGTIYLRDRLETGYKLTKHG